MVPRRTMDENGGFMVRSFIESAKTKGLDEALKTWDEATKNWGNRMDHKGIEVSNDGSIADYIPFGPAIRGTYDDCGNISPSKDEENQKRIKLLEGIFFGIPFYSLMNVATDDRWYTYGLGKYDGKPDNMWKLPGVDNSLPDFILNLCKSITVTYFHAPVYDTLIDPEFSAEGRMDSYDKKWQDEYIGRMRKTIGSIIKIGDKKDESKFPRKLIELIRDSRVHLLESMNREFSLILVTSSLREGSDFEWLVETSRLTSAMSGMCLKFKRSNYGSQHFNWGGWEKISEALKKSIDESRAKYYGDWDDDEDDDDDI
jgi:hypothetical protein